MRGNSVGRSAPDGFARQESLGGQSDARERYSGSGNRESPGLSVPNGFGRQETVGGQPVLKVGMILKTVPQNGLIGFHHRMKDRMYGYIS